MTSGGRNRSTLPKVPQVSTIIPLAWQVLATFAAAAASGSIVPGLTSSIASIAPRPRTSPMTGLRLGQLAQSRQHDRLDRARGARQVFLLHGVDRAERGRAGDRVTAVGAAEAAGVHRVHHARPGR